jgi:hypothetical protein
MNDENSEMIELSDPAVDNVQYDNNIKLDHDKVIIFKNPDKKTRVRLGPEDYMPYNGSRILLSGPPNSGKRNLILNIIYRMQPRPSAIHIVHNDPYTTEYDILSDLNIPIFIYGPQDMPDKTNIVEAIDIEEGMDEQILNDTNNKNKQLSVNPIIIVDEITHDNLNNICRHRFERIVNEICTHCNTLLLCSIQSLLNIGPKCRRGFNQYILWRQCDDQLNKLIANRTSMKPEILDDLFKLCSSNFDNITIDLDSDRDSEWRYRLNYIYPIEFILSTDNIQV